MSHQHTFWRNKNKSPLVNGMYIAFRMPTLAGVVGGVFVAGAGALVFVGQVISYLKAGRWESRPWVSFFSEMDAFRAWLYQPESWVGLSRMVRGILEWLPMSFGLVITGLPVALFFAVLHANIAAHHFGDTKPKPASEAAKGTGNARCPSDF